MELATDGEHPPMDNRHRTIGKPAFAAEVSSCELEVLVQAHVSVATEELQTLHGRVAGSDLLQQEPDKVLLYLRLAMIRIERASALAQHILDAQPKVDEPQEEDQ